VSGATSKLIVKKMI